MSRCVPDDDWGRRDPLLSDNGYNKYLSWCHKGGKNSQ